MDLSRITDDTPLRLETAVKIAFPEGGMTVSGLRRERDRGNLAVEMIAGKEFTTLADIKEMRRKCREHQREPGSTRSQNAATRKPARSLSKPSGSSETDELSAARASALQIAESLQRKPKRPLGNTSSGADSRRGKNNVLPLKSQLLT